MAIETEEEAISEFLEALEEEPQQPDPKQKKPKFKSEEVAETPTPRRGTCLAMTWPLSEQKVPEPVLGIPINTPFIESLAKIPEYAKSLPDLLATRQQLKKCSMVILSEQSSRAVLGEIPKKMRDLGRLTLPCEFGNNMKVDALANYGARINLMPYSFYQKLDIQKLKVTRMTIHMVNR
ncbi:uncharacterized protein LOC111901094 [Lactuca sativa]|uniref:uncharacterized protein LOC111901094 n=1 Tax=Lactuca sativa TaxID=4236 RepID=UPI000CD7F7B8|nr:uncharacterized protein LOC111901094 [Lactuca sativa]